MKYIFLLSLLLPLFVLGDCSHKSQASDSKPSYGDSDTVIVNAPPPKFNLDENIRNWYYLEPTKKYMNVIHMVAISDGAFQYTVSDPNDDENTPKEMFKLVKDVTKCVDSSGHIYYEEYLRDVKIGSVLIGCMIRSNFH